jgi:hypothetical protein
VVLQRPDVVHIATEGPLGWSALQAARHLKLPVTSDFRTNFHAYSRHYGIGWLRKPIMAYLRKLPQPHRGDHGADRGAAARAAGLGFRQVRWWRAASTPACSRRSGAVRALRSPGA